MECLMLSILEKPKDVATSTFFYVAFLKNVCDMKDVNDVIMLQHLYLPCDDNLNPIIDTEYDLNPWEYEVYDDDYFLIYDSTADVIKYLKHKLQRAEEDKRIFFGIEGVYPELFSMDHNVVKAHQEMYIKTMQRERDFYKKKGFVWDGNFYVKIK